MSWHSYIKYMYCANEVKQFLIPEAAEPQERRQELLKE